MGGAILGLLFNSCQDEISTDNILNQKELNGIPQFTNQEQFLADINNYKATKILPQTMSNIKTLSFTSSLKSDNIEEEIEEDTIVYSDLLKEFLNDKYEIIIGDIFFKITSNGTYFTSTANYKILRELSLDEFMPEDLESVTSALGYTSEYGMYKVLNKQELYLFDTYRKIDPIEVEPNIQIETLKSSSFPNNVNWINIDDGRSFAGKSWDKIWGFSKSVRNYFDSKHRVDVKFYAQRFPFYSEVGIKTKYQRRGWTRVWRKDNCDEILNGWEVLNMKEKWKQNIFGPDFNYNDHHIPDYNFQTEVAKDLGYVQSIFLDKPFRSFCIMGLDIDFSQRDKVGALWWVANNAGKVTTDFLSNHFSNPNNYREAIVLMPMSNYVTETKLSLAPYYEKRTNTDKYTMIVYSSFGGSISMKIGRDGSFEYEWPVNLSAEYAFLSNSVLYGAARRGSSWRGVKITFK